MKDKVIVHADLNHCYAQIEEMLHPELRHFPMAVGGNEKTRHGIILAKNNPAKARGIKTAETLRNAYAKCPNLLVIPPHYQDYLYYTEQVKAIYREYTDRVESFGLDEAWFDLTASIRLFGDPIRLAKTIQERIHKELGLTVSMGISFNKIFAKLGSDLDKEKGFTVLTRENFRKKCGELPVTALFYVGPATAKKLRSWQIYTISQLADTSFSFLQKKLGKQGEMIWRFANGYDETSVKEISSLSQAKSIGNGVTVIRDLYRPEDTQKIARMLCENIAGRLRAGKWQCRVVSVRLRDKNLESFSRQITLPCPSDLAAEILKAAISLCETHCPCGKDGYYITPYRSLSIEAQQLCKADGEVSCDLFDAYKKREKERKLECTIDSIRQRYGFRSIQRLSLLGDKELTSFHLHEDSVPYQGGWF